VVGLLMDSAAHIGAALGEPVTVLLGVPPRADGLLYILHRCASS